MDKSPQALLTARGVKERTGLPTSTIYELAAKGELPCLRIGRAVRFPERALDEWIECNTVKGPRDAA
jgi:excisionase family DNA binding protein